MQEPQETRVQSLGQILQDSLEEGMATHFIILAWRICMDRGAWQATVHRVTKSRTRLKGLSTGNVEHDLETDANKECFDS